MARKSRKFLAEAFGTGEDGGPDLPARVGNRRIARLVSCRARGGCSYCFPHGHETTNGAASKNRRSWKFSRKTQHRRIA